MFVAACLLAVLLLLPFLATLFAGLNIEIPVTAVVIHGHGRTTPVLLGLVVVFLLTGLLLPKRH